MSSAEQRKEKRIKIDQLPEKYRHFSVLLSQGTTIQVETKDASLNGFGFLANLNESNFIVSTRLVLYPLGDEHPVYGKIVYAMEIDGKTRVGVQLQPLGGYQKYAEEIQKILDALAEAQ